MLQETKRPSFFSKLISMLSAKKSPEESTRLRPPPNSTNEFEHVFKYFDKDGDEKISPTELRNRMEGLELTLEDVEEVVWSADSDGDGYLGFDDFVKWVEVEGGVDGEEKGRSLREAFEVYGEGEGEGCMITAESLRRVLERVMGEVRSVEECREMVRRFDVDGDGLISFEEFRVIWPKNVNARELIKVLN